MEQLELTSDIALDLFQAELSKHPAINNPLVHIFTPGLYTRQIMMPNEVDGLENWIISKIHKTTHTFCLSAGKAAVYNKADEFLGVIEAPYLGVTIAGTRRILRILETAVWATFHPLPYITGEENSWSADLKEMLLMKIEQDLIEEREVSLRHL